MPMVALTLLTCAAWPLWIAWRATAATTLRHGVAWAVAAWAAWILAVSTNSDLAAYVAISLSGCAGVAVLGARRPGVGAWNFVVAGLFAVLLLPVAQGLGTPRVETAQLIFLGATLAVPVLNYLPTRLGPAVLLCGLGCAAELARLSGVRCAEWQETVGQVCLAAGPWFGLLTKLPRAATSPFERTWLDYRDRFGFVWAQRSREQFNRAAENAGWGVRLRWRRLEQSGAGTVPDEVELQKTLAAVLKRFGAD
jgi:hypothetical protein